MSIDLESLGLTDMIRLRERLSETLARRFERTLAMAFSEAIGEAATPEDATREAHLALLAGALEGSEGRVVSAAGASALSCFPSVDLAVTALIELQRALLERPGPGGLAIRSAVHWASVFCDGELVTGPAVDECARMTVGSPGGTLLLSRAAANELPSRYRFVLRAIPTREMPENLPAPMDVLALEWRERVRTPTAFRIAETGEVHRLPPDARIRCGRLRERESDIVLELPDPARTMRISRAHFELQREGAGLYLVPLGDRPVSVDSRPVTKGHRRRLDVGAAVRVAQVMTLTFLSDEEASDASMVTQALRPGD